MEVGNPLQMRNSVLPSNLNLDQTDINLSTKLRNLGVVSQISSCYGKKESYRRSYKHCKNIEVYR